MNSTTDDEDDDEREPSSKLSRNFPIFDSNPQTESLSADCSKSEKYLVRSPATCVPFSYFVTRKIQKKIMPIVFQYI